MYLKYTYNFDNDNGFIHTCKKWYE